MSFLQTTNLTEPEALALAQLLKRIGWSEVRQNAVNDDEAYLMMQALERVRSSLADAGFAPR